MKVYCRLDSQIENNAGDLENKGYCCQIILQSSPLKIERKIAEKRKKLKVYIYFNDLSHVFSNSSREMPVLCGNEVWSFLYYFQTLRITRLQLVRSAMI